MKGVYIFLANGFEDIEALGTRDFLVRGGVDVKTVSISSSLQVTSSHNVKVLADMSLPTLLEQFEGHESTGSEDAMVFPGGGEGSKNLGACEELLKLMNEHYKAGGTVCAICAAPAFTLSRLETEELMDFTCFDGFQDILIGRGWHFLMKPAVTCKGVITGRGSGHSLDFAAAILQHIKGTAAVEKVRSSMFLKCD